LREHRRAPDWGIREAVETGQQMVGPRALHRRTKHQPDRRPTPTSAAATESERALLVLQRPSDIFARIVDGVPQMLHGGAGRAAQRAPTTSS